MDAIIVSNINVSDQGSRIELSADIRSSDDLIDTFTLWYRFPATLSGFINQAGDPFLAVLLPIAMKKKYDLVIDAPVSERLCINTQQAMKLLSGWFDYMEPVNIQPQVLQRDHFSPNAVGSFFSGGLDSFYTVLKNLENYKNESRISHLLFVHGFDIDINNNTLFSDVYHNQSAIAEKLGLKLIIVETNLRKFTDQYISWGKNEYGPALASVGLGLSKLFKTILIPSGHPYAEVYPTGIHPLLDPLWSNESTHFMEDGNEADRIQKIQWQLSKSPVALSHLRVCWRNPDNEYNCGHCAKCIRTKINLRMAGVLDQCTTLDSAIDFDLLADLTLNNPKEKRMLKEALDYAVFNNSDKSIKEGLQWVLKQAHTFPTIRERIRSFDQNYLGSILKKYLPSCVKEIKFKF